MSDEPTGGWGHSYGGFIQMYSTSTGGDTYYVEAPVVASRLMRDARAAQLLRELSENLSEEVISRRVNAERSRELQREMQLAQQRAKSPASRARHGFQQFARIPCYRGARIR